MRKQQKQQILEIIKNLHILHGVIRNRLMHKDYQNAQALLVNCQEAAIGIGEVIEGTEGDGTQAVFHLERYCEKVYWVNEQARIIPDKTAYKTLKSSLIDAEREIKRITVKLEVVFLPYKVSMWDSLESVWMAADEDSDCDAYVIPIPYFDKNKDGSL